MRGVGRWFRRDSTPCATATVELSCGGRVQIKTVDGRHVLTVLTSADRYGGIAAAAVPLSSRERARLAQALVDSTPEGR